MNIFVYRNCFTGDISGGDMHTGGLVKWIHDIHPDSSLKLIHPCNDGQDKAYEETAQVESIEYKDSQLNSLILKWLQRAWRGARVRLSLSTDPTVIVAGSHLIPDVWPVYRQGLRKKNITRVVYIHHIVQDMPRAKGFNTLAANLHEKLCFFIIKRKFDRIITVNKEVVNGLRQRGFKQDILVSSNFVNPHKAQPKTYDQRDIDISFCGRFVEQKGVFDFVSVCQELQKQDIKFKAVMIGVGPELERIQRQINLKELNVTVKGRVTEEEKFDLLSRSKVFVFPSIEEGWGIAIAEALSLGVPVLAYDLPVYREVFKGKLHVVPLKRVDLLQEASVKLLVEYQRSVDEFAKEQQSITRYAEAFQLDSVIRKEWNFITELSNEQSY